MSKTRTALITAIAIGLLAGSAVGVTAQAPENGAPTEFSATWDFNFGPGVRRNVDSGSDPVQGRGYANHPRVVETGGDPRFDGEVTMTVNRDTYASEGALEGTLSVFHRAFTVENEEGIWRGVSHPFLYFPDGEAAGTTQLFIGEEGYSGSYALADIRTDQAGGVWVLRGVIFEGELPPAPEPFVSE